MRELFRISHNKETYSKPVQFHSHDFCEIYFFVDGNVKYYIEDECYDLRRGDILVIPPGKLHRPVIKNNLPYDRYVLWIYNAYSVSNDGIKKFLEAITLEIDQKKTRRVSFKGELFQIMAAFFDKLLAEWEKISCADGFDDATSAECLLRLHVCDSCMILVLEKILETLQNIEKTDTIDNNLIRQVISYLNDNVTDTPSLDALSSRFYVSKYYLSHQFKEYTKMTIHQYILSKKINLAKELLENGKNPQQVCNLCGFSTYSNFYKVFTKQTGGSPREFLS